MAMRPSVIYRIEHAGKSVTFSGDIDAQGLPALRRIAKSTDLLVFNTVVLDPPGSPAILYTLHTPPHAIGQLAKDVGAGALLLSHISPAVDESQQRGHGLHPPELCRQRDLCQGRHARTALSLKSALPDLLFA